MVLINQRTLFINYDHASLKKDNFIKPFQGMLHAVSYDSIHKVDLTSDSLLYTRKFVSEEPYSISVYDADALKSEEGKNNQDSFQVTQLSKFRKNKCSNFMLWIFTFRNKNLVHTVVEECNHNSYGNIKS